MSSAWSQDSTQVTWTNFSFDSTTQNAVLFRDAAGVALSAGPTTANNNGRLVQLGYYSMSSMANSFSGTWIPLTGAFSTPFQTTIGDSSDGVTGSGPGVADFVTRYDVNTSSGVVYPGGTGTYITSSSQMITSSQPPAGQILSIRFYDTNDGLSGSYNAVSANNWQWQVPTTSGGGGAQVTLFVADAFADGPGGALADLEWESFDVFGIPHATGDFRTVIAVPEPSTWVFGATGLIGLVAFRRRSKK